MKGIRISDSRSKISLEDHDTTRHLSYSVWIYTIHADPTRSRGLSAVVSSRVPEGEGLLQGIVQWNETFEL